ncbi:hypothetical protein MHJ63_00290 [Pseudoglutamicibacter albus]|uniref:hypothetical protein n=1 Tax=Pseudoglutamicibacter albus TaxID=98671 RepID=UPI001EF5FC11|nr:hypothetical protein [Pseudoglutamicibacter albus]MCG7303730.1 hypothetical protein [Pseudoglutamicibacter albus]
MSLPTPPGPAGQDVEPFEAAPAELDVPAPQSSWEPTDWEPTDWEPDSDAVDAAIAKRLGVDSEDIYAAVRAAEQQADAIADPHVRAAEPVIPAPQVPDEVGLDAPVSEKVSMRGVVEAAAAEVGQEIAHGTVGSDAGSVDAPETNDAPAAPDVDPAPAAPHADQADVPDPAPASPVTLPPPPAPPEKATPEADTATSADAEPAESTTPPENTAQEGSTPRGFLPPPPAPPAP